MALGTGVHNLSLAVRATNRTRRVFQQVGRDLTLLDKTRQVTQKGFGQLATVGVMGIKAMAVGIGVAIGGSILAYSKLDAAMTQSLAIAGEVAPEMRKKMEDAARGIALTTTFSASEAAAAYFNLLSAGQDTAQAMESLPTVAAFAQAGMFDLEQATELLVTSQNALGLAFEDPIKNGLELARIADVLASADKSAVGSIEDFAEALTNRAAASMRTYGIEVEEGVAVLAAWATQGLKGKTAGEAFAIVTRDLQKAALNEADAWREVGAAVYDSQGNMRNMADIVGDLEEAMEGLTDAEKKQLLTDLGFQERSQQRLLQLLGTSDAIRQFEKDFKSAGGTVEEVAEKQLDTATQQLKLLWSAITDIFIGAGSEFDSGFVDAIKRIKEWVIAIGPDAQEAAKKFVDWINEVVDKLILLKTHFKLVADGQDNLNERFYSKFGPVAQFIIRNIDKIIRKWQELSQPIRDAIGDWAKLLPVISLVAGGLKILGIVLGIFAGPGAIVAGVIAGLIIGFKYLWENSETFRQVIQNVIDFFTTRFAPMMSEAWSNIQSAAGGFLDWFTGTALPWLIGAWETIQGAIDTFLVWFEGDALPWLIELWDQIKETFAAAWEFISTLFETVTTFLTEVWNTFGDDIWRAAENIWELIKDVILGAWEVIEGIFQVFTAVLTGDWSKLWEGIKSIFSGLWGILWGIIQAAWNNMLNFIKGILDKLGIGWDDFWGGLRSVAARAWIKVKSWFTDKWESFKSAWETGWQALADFVKGAIAKIPDALKWPFNQILSMIEDVINLGIGGINGLIGLANKIPGVDIGVIGEVHIPRLAEGGKIMARGLAIVGEAGPELLRVPRGAVVEPLPRSPDSRLIGQGDTIIFQGTPAQILADWRRESKLRMAGL